MACSELEGEVGRDLLGEGGGAHAEEPLLEVVPAGAHRRQLERVLDAHGHVLGAEDLVELIAAQLAS